MSLDSSTKDEETVPDELEKAPTGHRRRSSGPLNDLDSIELTNTGAYVWLVTTAVAIGGLLFGYDTGVISGVLVVIGTDLGKKLTDADKELITSLTSGGAFVGAAIAGLMADRFGRRLVIGFSAIVFTVGAIVQAAAFGLAQMAVGRFIIGLGVGAAAMIVPVYIAELSPAKHRGRMVTVDAMSITGGQVISYALDAAFQHVPHGWRIMVGLGGLPSILLLIFMFFCPDSPRQLIFHEKHDECRRVLHKIYPKATEQQVSDKITLIEGGMNEVRAISEHFTLWRSLKELYTVKSNFRALVVACGLMAIQQFCGFNTLMYYSGTLFAMVGFKDPIAVGIVVAATNFLFAGVSLKWIDQVGRRRMLVWTMWGMWFWLVVAAVAFHWIPIDRKTLSVATNNPNWAAIVVLIAIIFFVASYATGLGNVPWQATEFFPMEVRSLAFMMMTLTNWGPNLIVSSTFLSMMRKLTPSGEFGFYAALCFFGWIAVIICYPECSNMTLEETREVFKHGFGVKYAEQWRKEHRAKLRARKEMKEAFGGTHPISVAET